MLGDMPCGKEVVLHWPQTPEDVEIFIDALQQAKWFCFATVDVEVPRELWEKSEEMRPLFYNEPVLQHMKEYLARSKSKPMHNKKSWLAHFQRKRSCYTPRS